MSGHVHHEVWHYYQDVLMHPWEDFAETFAHFGARLHVGRGRHLWPAFDTPVYVERVPRWDGTDYVDPRTPAKCCRPGSRRWTSRTRMPSRHPVDSAAALAGARRHHHDPAQTLSDLMSRLVGPA